MCTKNPQNKYKATSIISIEIELKPLSCENWIWFERSSSQKEDTSEESWTEQIGDFVEKTFEDICEKF